MDVGVDSQWTMPQHGVPPRRPGFAPYRTVVLDDRRAGCPSCWMTAVLAKCVAASPGKQNKEPVQDCVLLRCCFAWQAQKGARARLRSAALLLCLASAKRRPCKTAFCCVAACCIAALPGKRKKGARARLRSAALLLCLASAKRLPCKTALRGRAVRMRRMIDCSLPFFYFC